MEQCHSEGDPSNMHRCDFEANLGLVVQLFEETLHVLSRHSGIEVDAAGSQQQTGKGDGLHVEI